MIYFIEREAYIRLCSCGSVAKLCLTPCNPMDCSLRGSSVHGIFQATVLEWGAIAFSHQTHRSVQFSRQVYWSGLPFPSPRDLPNPGIQFICFISPSLVVQFSSVQWLSRVQLFATPWTTACQASLSMINSGSPPKLAVYNLWRYTV